MKDDVLEMAKELQARPELRQLMKEAATASPQSWKNCCGKWD